MDRRQTLAALASAFAFPAFPAAPEAPPAGWTSVRGFGARGDGRHDDSAAFQAGLDRASRLWVPPGRYLVGGLVLRSHNRLRGAGEASVLAHRPGSAFIAAINPGNDGSPDPRDNVREVAIEHLAFTGRGAAEGFREHVHLLNLNGCSRVTVERCAFRAFQGDAIYLGSGNVGNVERHNEDIGIRHCLFDGIDYANRNAVSVIDGRRVAIERNLFRNCSRHDMPGAVDIEPDPNDFHVIRDIRIAGNRFENVQGAVGAICVILPVPRFTEPPRGIEIAGNRIEGRFRTPGIVVRAFVDATTQPDLELRVTGNDILETIHGFEFSGVRGVRFERNRVLHTQAEPVVSFPRRGRCDDVLIAQNHFRGLAMHTGHGLRVYPTARLRIESNRFEDCGWHGQAGGAALTLEAPEGSIGALRANAFGSGRGSGRTAIRCPGDSRDAETRLRALGNRFGAGLRAVAELPGGNGVQGGRL